MKKEKQKSSVHLLHKINFLLLAQIHKQENMNAIEINTFLLRKNAFQIFTIETILI